MIRPAGRAGLAGTVHADARPETCPGTRPDVEPVVGAPSAQIEPSRADPPPAVAYMRDKAGTVGNGKRHPCPPVRLVESKAGITLPEMCHPGLGQKIEALAPGKMAPRLGPQHCPLSVMAGAAGMASEEHRRQVEVPLRSGTVAVPELKLNPEIYAAVPPPGDGEPAGRVAQPP